MVESHMFRLKLSRGASSLIFIAFVFIGFAAMAQTPMPNSALTENPIYRKNCAKCHGKTAEGRHFGGPSLISEKTSATSADTLSNIITNGKGRMPKYANKLTPDEVSTLVRQIQALNKK
jgi:cytochrome c5